MATKLSVLIELWHSYSTDNKIIHFSVEGTHTPDMFSSENVHCQDAQHSRYAQIRLIS